MCSGSGDDATDAATHSGSPSDSSGCSACGFSLYSCRCPCDCGDCSGGNALACADARAAAGSGGQSAGTAETSPAAENSPAATSSQFTEDYMDESETSAESLPPLVCMALAVLEQQQLQQCCPQPAALCWMFDNHMVCQPRALYTSLAP